MGRTEAAIQQFTHALACDETSVDLLWLRLQPLVTEDRREEALVKFARAVEIGGSAADHLWYGKTLVELGRCHEAVHSLTLAVAGRGAPEDIYWLGRSLAGSGAKEDAADEFAKVVSSRGWGEDFYWLGRTLTELDRGADALPHLRRAVTSRGTAEDFHWLGLALLQTGWKEEAVKQFDLAVQKRGNCDDHYWLGTALIDEGRFSDALPHLEEAVEFRGDGLDYHSAGIALENLGRKVEACSQFRMAVEKRGDSADYLELAKSLYGLKRRDEAVLMFQRALEIRKDPLHSHWVGRALLETGSPLEALPHLEEAYRKRNGAIDLLLLKRCLGDNLRAATKLGESGSLLDSERVFRRAMESVSGMEELTEQSSDARSGWQKVRSQLQRFRTFDDSLLIFAERELSSAIAARPAGGTEIQTGELSQIGECQWLEATLPDGGVGFILVPKAPSAPEIPPEAQEPAVEVIDVAQDASQSEAAQRELAPNAEEGNPPYARFTVQLVSSSILASVFVFEMADATTRGQWDNVPLALVGFVGAAMVALGARITWHRIAAVGSEGEIAPKRRRRVMVTSSVIVIGLLAGAATVGSVIGQNRAEAIQLAADLKHMTEVGERISKARSAVEATVDSYVQMYKAIEPDVKELEATLQRLKMELGIYDTKFPAQHDVTSKSIAGMDKGLQRMVLLQRQIEVAKNIDSLQASQQTDAWKGQMLPLLTQEEDLDKVK